MAIRRIRLYGDPELRKIADTIENIDDEIREVVQDMIDTMYANDGIGLAATQIGVSKQLFVLDSREDDQPNPLVFINPVVKNQQGTHEMEEGCLSIPEIRENVKRAESFDFEALDLNGEKVEFHADGILARIIFHEVDHLNGRMFVDYLLPVKKMMLKEQLKQIEKRSRKESSVLLS